MTATAESDVAMTDHVIHLSQRQLARRWHLSPRTLERWRSSGQGPVFMKLGGRVVYALPDVEAYERAQRRSPEHVPGSEP
jgi:predicted site-specific integrase-resolvase